MDKIKTDFILVSGDSDIMFPNDMPIHIYKKLNVPNLLQLQTIDIPDNCEHIPFHIQAKQNGAKIYITPKILFTDICRD